jgi:hypothetical protein
VEPQEAGRHLAAVKLVARVEAVAQDRDGVRARLEVGRDAGDIERLAQVEVAKAAQDRELHGVFANQTYRAVHFAAPELQGCIHQNVTGELVGTGDGQQKLAARTWRVAGEGKRQERIAGTVRLNEEIVVPAAQEEIAAFDAEVIGVVKPVTGAQAHAGEHAELAIRAE